MSEDLMKFNPGFKSDAQILSEFIVRKADLSLILDTIRGNVSAPCNQHLLVIGPRGIGKTSLVLRVAAEIRHEDPELGRDWYPVVFSEESYSVSTPGEFWLDAVFHVAQQRDDNAWRSAYEELRDEKDEARLRDRAIAKLTDLADREGKRLLLIVENLQMLLGDQLSDDDAWVLRETLQNEPRIMLLGTATTRFWEMDSANQAFYETFKVLDLKPLSTAECQQLWEAVSGEAISAQRVRPVEILTGGNPRLLAVIATFAARSSFRELMNDLTRLVDDHTDYFKSHLDDLPAMERKVFVALCDVWDPATARQVARLARTDTNKASAQLRRLMKRGAVVADQTKRKKTYRVTERLYNIYYLMRRRGTPAARVRALVKFMVSFYEEKELLRVAAAIAKEAAWLTEQEIEDYIALFEGLRESVPELQWASLSDGMIEAVTSEVQTAYSDAVGAFKTALKTQTPGDVEEAATRLRELTMKLPNSPDLALMLAFLFVVSGSEEQRHEAPELYEKAANLAADNAWTLFLRSVVALQIGKNDEAQSDCRTLLAAEPPPPEEFPGFEQAMETLGGTVLQSLREATQASEFAEEFLLRTNRSAASLNCVAWTAHTRWGESYAGQSEAWAREAHGKASADGAIAHTLAAILASRGDWSEALDLVPTMLADGTSLEKHRSEYTDFLVDSAAAGHTARVLKHLGRSPAATALEPVLCALRLDAGEKVSLADEILEVAQDVLAKIREKREELKERSDEAKRG